MPVWETGADLRCCANIRVRKILTCSVPFNGGFRRLPLYRIGGGIDTYPNSCYSVLMLPPEATGLPETVVFSYDVWTGVYSQVSGPPSALQYWAVDPLLQYLSGPISSGMLDGGCKTMIESFSLDSLPEPAEGQTTVGVVTGSPAFPVLTVGGAPPAFWSISTARGSRQVGSPPVVVPIPEWAWAAPGAGHAPSLARFSRTDLEVEIDGPGLRIDWEVGREGVSAGFWPVPIQGGPWVYECNRPTPNDPPGGLLPLVSYSCQVVGDPRCTVRTRHKLVHQDCATPATNLGYYDLVYCGARRVQMIIPSSSACPSTP